MFNLPKITELSWKQCMWFPFLTEDAFSLLFFFFSVFFFHLGCAKYKSQDDTSVTYGRDWWQARSYMSRHTVPLYLFMRGVSVNHFACICTFWTQILEEQEKKSTNQSQYCLILFFAVLWCQLGQLHMTLEGRFSAGTVPIWDPILWSSPMQRVQLCSCSIIMLR